MLIYGGMSGGSRRKFMIVPSFLINQAEIAKGVKKV